MSDYLGKFVWYELMTTDVQVAGAFYRSVVGWNTQVMGTTVDGDPYTIFQIRERGVGGLMTVPSAAQAAGARPAWMGYVAVDDVDAYAERVTKAGGAVHHKPEDIPGVGRFAVATDPQGAGFILFKPIPPAQEPPPLAPDAPGTIGWRELIAVDGVAAFDFYAGLFGWTKAESFDMGPMGVYQLYAAQGETLGGMMSAPAETPAPFWLYYIRVDGLGAAIDRLKSGGGNVLMGPHQVPTGEWIVQGVDPQGTMFALLSATP